MKPILFNTEMVQALLKDRKTVTRRKIKLDLGLADTDKNDNTYLKIPDDQGDYHDATVYCRYRVGDTLYVKETWQESECFDYAVKNKYVYRANEEEEKFAKEFNVKWRPSIHMPKKAARILLRVTGVRVERLKNIDIRSIKNEGIRGKSTWDYVDYLERFEELWNSTVRKQDLSKYGWESNPWVWVIEFEKLGLGEVE